MVIASGGTSRIYKCHSEKGDTYALKELLPESDGKYSKNRLKRFKNEICVQSEMSCSYVVPCIAYDFDCECPKYIMPLYSGTLRDIINNNNNSAVEKLMLFLELCEAVDCAHRRGIIHRDLKPENVMYDGKHLYLGDFGIAHLKNSTLTGKKDALANRNYFAPEQRPGSNIAVSPGTDVYALGLILNELFTGEIPHGDRYKRISDTYPLFGGLDPIVSSMIRQNLDERLGTTSEAVVQIECFLEDIRKKYESWRGFVKIPPDIDSEKAERIVRMAFEDIQMAEIMINNGTMSEWSINRNYHSNIVYDARSLTDSIILLDIYERLRNRFEYEGAGLYHNGNYVGPPEDEKLKKGVYESFIAFITELNLLGRDEIERRSYENIKGICVKYYRAIYHYELWKINFTIEKMRSDANKNTLNAPIMALSLAISRMRKTHLRLCDLEPFVFGTLISINWDLSSDIVTDGKLIDDIFKSEEQSKIEMAIRNQLTQMYPKMVIVEERGIYSLYFEKEDYDSFRKICKERGKRKKLDCADYLELFDYVKQYEKYTVVGLYDVHLYGNLNRILSEH